MEAERLKIALEFLKEGKSFRVEGLRFGMENETIMYVTGWSQYSSIEILNKHQTLRELNDIKALFKRMVEASSELKKFIQKKKIKYNLAVNYGMGSIGICYEENGIVKWELELLS